MKERTLDLVLKGCWYDLIKSGVKREEYREIKPYWCKKIFHTHSCHTCGQDTPTYVRFRRGYTKESMLFKIDDISIGIGKAELGAPQEEVFIIKFSEI